MHSYSIQYPSRCPKGMASNILPLIILSLYATLLLAWLSQLFTLMMSSFMKVTPSVLLIWNDILVSYSIQKIGVLFTISFQIKLLVLFRVSLSLSLTKVICTWSFFPSWDLGAHLIDTPMHYTIKLDDKHSELFADVGWYRHLIGKLI